jgi:Flp pilus assembly protein TadG
MGSIRHLISSATRFATDRRGNFAVLTGLAVSTLALGVGFGVNVLQAYHVKTALRDALDAAVTSTARDLTTGVIAEKDARKTVEAFLTANTDGTFALGDAYVLDSLVIDRSARTVEASVSARVDLAFPLFFDNSPRVVVSSGAVYSDKKIEVAMMLDITGSMAKTWRADKIGDLKTAASNAVESIMSNQDPKNPRIRMSIVPYAEGVNVGALASTAVFAEKAGGPDLPPPIDQPLAASAGTPGDACATERKLRDGAADFSDDGPFTERRNNNGRVYLARINRDDRLSVCPQARLVPLTADKKQLLASIDSFRADGVTAGAVAIQWTYYMLSPKWRSAIQAASLGNGAADHNPQKVSKVAILMTDGQFNTAFAGVEDGPTSNDRYNPRLKQGNRARQYAESLCTRMKADGISVFTIGFDLDSPQMTRIEREQAKGVLKTCASTDTASVKHYFEASTGAELDAAFKKIIRNAERLALTR